jgi:DNA-binding GntR family transcriptional regulator
VAHDPGHASAREDRDLGADLLGQPPAGAVALAGALALRVLAHDLPVELRTGDVPQRARDLGQVLLVERCGNRRLARMLATIMDQSHRARLFTLRLRPRPVDSVPQHRLTVEAVLQGDAASARERAARPRAAARDLTVPLLTRYGEKRL